MKSAKSKSTGKRTRLSPEKRRIQLLNSAKALILDRGLNAFTMDALTQAAGVSTPLVYKYFDTRLELLQALLIQESEQSVNDFNEKLKITKEPFELVKLFVEANFDQASEGHIVSLLLKQPDVAAVLINTNKQRYKDSGVLLVSTLSKHFGYSRKQAKLIASMASSASFAAADFCHQSKGNKKQMVDSCMQFIWAGMESLSSGN